MAKFLDARQLPSAACRRTNPATGGLWPQPLLASNALIGGVPGQGKTSVSRQIALTRAVAAVDERMECLICEGTGKFRGRDCSACNGDGKL
ncbi:hypothetical protein [Saccharopolyspora taberi]|uniref:Uncharacterized protein n=1 Tax=Saccharopolyspora taberi TaxID=60895 RepID=A0ABN3V4L6_9PSEU